MPCRSLAARRGEGLSRGARRRPRAARGGAGRTDFPRDKIEGVSHAIASHVGLFREEPPEPIEAAVLFDADKISKLGAISIVHFLCSQPAATRVVGRPAETSSAAQELRRWADLAPRIVDGLSTPAGREMGRQRLEFLRVFVAQLEAELHM